MRALKARRNRCLSACLKLADERAVRLINAPPLKLLAFTKRN
jgi:hypothetical protein